jgi:hypothetical protein
MAVAANQDDQTDRLFRRLDHDRKYDAYGTPNVNGFAQASFG